MPRSCDALRVGQQPKGGLKLVAHALSEWANSLRAG